MFTDRLSRMMLALTLATAPALLASIPPTLAQSSSPALRPKRAEDPEKYYRAPSTMSGKTVVVPIGTTWEGRIDQTISSAHSHTGQRFNIIMSTPVMLNGSDVIVPAGSQIMGEVVEAIPASRVPRAKFQNKNLIRGKLEIAISGLRTPDGVTYPLVASLVGEVSKNRRSWNSSAPIGTSVGYVGTDAQFRAFDPTLGRKPNERTGRRTGVVTKRELLRDPILGAGDDGYNQDSGRIRSLLQKGRDYYVFEGSPLSIKLQAPFRIGVNTPTGGVPVTSVSDAPVEDTLPPPTRGDTSAGASGFGGGAQRSVAAPPQQSQGIIPADSF